MPGSAVSVWPSSGVPEIDGGVTFGGREGEHLGRGREVALSLPAPLVAVTMTRIGAADVARDEVVGRAGGPGRSTQLVPSASQRCHWYV